MNNVNLWVTFTVEVSDSEYSYDGRRGISEVRVHLPRLVLESIDPGNLFVGAMMAALANFDACDEDDQQDS